jgi:hypothetical protein
MSRYSKHDGALELDIAIAVLFVSIAAIISAVVFLGWLIFG